MEFFNTLGRLSSLVKNTNNSEKAQPKLLRLWFLTIFTLLQLGKLLNAQSSYNLVDNYSFENNVHCPTSLSDTKPPMPWYVPQNYSGVYANSCSSIPNASVPYNFWGSGISYQYALTGNGYAALFFRNLFGSNARNYIQTKLKDSLVSGGCYYIEFFVSLANSMKGGCNNISIAISNNIIWTDTINNPHDVIPFNAQIYNYGNPVITDTINWVKVSSVYVAQGGEQYITIGNFKYDNATQYQTIQTSGYGGAGYYVDDIQLIPLAMEPAYANAFAGDDITIAQGDSAFIGSLTNGISNIAWYNAAGQKIDSVAPGFWVKPTSSTFYVVAQTVCGNYSTDTVFVNVNPLPLKFISYTLRQAQGDKVENIWVTANEVNVSHFNILRSIDGVNFKVIGKVKAQNKSYNEYGFTDNGQLSTVDGRLYYRIESVDFDGRKQYSEIRNIKLETKTGISLSPNPAKEFVTVECKGAKELLIIDYLGRAIKQFNNATQPQTINCKQLTKGLYVVKATMANGQVKTEKLVIE